MPTSSLRRALDLLRLIERRARGLEPGDDAVSRLRLHDLVASPGSWIRMTLAKVAVVVVLATLAAGVFAGGLAMMRAFGVE